jgi:hypothetical protein
MMIFSFRATRSHWAVTLPVVLGILCTVLLTFLLVFYIFASLPAPWRAWLNFSWKYTAHKRTLMFISQVMSIPLAIGACLCVLFSYFIDNPEHMADCNSLQVGIVFFSLMMELVQSIFLFQKSVLTRNVWGKGFLLFHKLLYVYILISNPVLIVLMMFYIQGAFIISDNGLFQACGASVMPEIAVTFGMNSLLTNGLLFAIFYRSIKSVAASSASSTARPSSASTSTVLTPVEKYARLMKVARRNLISFCLISLSQLIFLLTTMIPGGDFGLATEGYLPVHFLVTNLIILYCTQAAWKKKAHTSKTPKDSVVDIEKNQNVSTGAMGISMSPHQSSFAEEK